MSNVASKIVTYEKHGTTWKVHRDLLDSPGLAFVQNYLSGYDLSGLGYIRLVTGAWGYSKRHRWTNNCGGAHHYASDPPYITAKVNTRTPYPSVGYTTVLVPGTWRKKKKVAVERFNIQEAVVEIIAHEVCHHLHDTDQLPSRGRYYWEVECGEFAQAAVEAYRAMSPVGQVEPAEAVTDTDTRRCAQCSMHLAGAHRGRFCSDGCRTRWHNARRHERLAQAWARVCEVCGTKFESHRNDARYCSGRCRQRARRQRL